MDLAKFCSNLAAELSTLHSDEEKLEVAAKALSEAFHVTSEEVAFLLLDSRLQILNFLWPLPLRNAGSLPLSVENSLATKTAREHQASLDNSFSSTPHSTIFEMIKLDPLISPLPIQKIMSAPVIDDEEVKGIIQISRKGTDPFSAGEDFSLSQLYALSRMSGVISEIFSH
jgi:hypothetical protein